MKKKILLVILFLVLLYASGGVYYSIYFHKEEETVVNIDAVKTYGYALKNNATELQKTEFNTLKTNLNSDEINDEEYAKSISKLFIIDLYTISNKINKYDVGAISYVYPDSLLNYKKNVEDTIYKYVEDNSNNDRKQELPEVATINITDTTKTKYKINDTEYTGYKIKLEWTYITDMGYDTKGEVIVIKVDKKYYVAEKN